MQGRLKTEELAYPSPPPPSVTRQHPTAYIAEGRFISREVCTARLKQGASRASIYETGSCLAPFSLWAHRLLAALLLFPRPNIEEFLSEECVTLVLQDGVWAWGGSAYGLLIVCGSLTLYRKDFTAWSRWLLRVYFVKLGTVK